MSCSMIVAEVKVAFNVKVSSTSVKRVWDKTIDQIGAEPGKGGGREPISAATKRRALDWDPVESFREATKEVRRTDGRAVSKSSIMRIWKEVGFKDYLPQPVSFLKDTHKQARLEFANRWKDQGSTFGKRL